MITPELIKDIKLGTNVTDGEKFKDTLEVIASIVSDTVVKTLGPYATTTIIDNGMSTYSTKDGWSVVNTLNFGDHVENTLYKFIKNISFALNSKVGDGTTTAIVASKMFIDVFRSWINEQRSNINSPFHHVRQAEILDTISNAAAEICKRLESEERLKRIDNPKDIYKIANISTNGNRQISDIITEIYTKTSNPSIHVTLNIGGETYYEIQNGYKLDANMLNPLYHINTGEGTCVFNNPVKIVIFNHNVTFNEHMQIVTSLINNAINTRNKIVIMAPYFDDIITSVLRSTLSRYIENKVDPAFVLVQVPFTTTLQKCMANDFAVLCGTEIFDYSRVKIFNHLLSVNDPNYDPESDKWDDYKYLEKASDIKSVDDIIKDVVGTANKLTIGKKFILLEEFKKDSDLYKNTLAEIKEAYETEKEKADQTKSYLSLDYSSAHMRYIKFTGSTGTIYVGGESELSCKCLKDAVDDAVLACQSAYNNGYIRGMNLETISVINEILTELSSKSQSNTLIYECYKMIGRVFINVTKEVMLNKYRNDGFDSAELKNMTWRYEFDSNNICTNKKWNKKIMNSNAKKRYDKKPEENRDMMDLIIDTCVELGLEYNLVTESFGLPGYSVVNSVSTDIEIIKATTNILTLLLSSNQLVSINTMGNESLVREKILEDKKTEYKYITNGILDAMEAHNVSLPICYTSELLSTEDTTALL